MNEKVGGEYVYKYSGGFATYPQWHAPIAIHAPGRGRRSSCWADRVVP